MIHSLKLIGILISVMLIAFPHNDTKTRQTENEVKDRDFASFLSYFPLIEAPYELKLSDLTASSSRSKNIFVKSGTPKTKLEQKKRNLLYDFLPQAKSMLFSRRSGYPTVIPIARVYLDKSHIAVIYEANRNMSAIFNRSIYIYVYNLNGELVPTGDHEDNTRPILLARSHTSTTTIGALTKNAEVVSTIYKNEFSKDPKTYGYNDNPIANYEKIKSETIKLLLSEIVSTP